ncbi:serpin family protein [Gemmatimonadota bacterium]
MVSPLNRIGSRETGHLTAGMSIAVILMTALLASSCGDGSPTGPGGEIEGLPRELSLAEEMLVEAGNGFAFRFLDQVWSEAPDSNLFIAPLSASLALGMTMNGAAGNTFEQMRTTLGFGSMSLAEINQGYRDLIDLLRALDVRVEVGIGNSIWYRQGFPVRQDFIGRAEENFDAVIREMDFSAPGAAGIINDWVDDQTRGKIKEIVEAPVDPLTVMFLINAIYFKGDWTHRFDKDKTAPAPFYGVRQSGADIPLMELSDTLPYAEREEYQVVDLPYGGKAFSMTVLLPKAGHSMMEILDSLGPQEWSQLIGSLQRKEGTVYLPRFRMEWERILNKTLMAMGMPDAFTGGLADFTGLSDEALQRGLYISKVKQKTYVDVDEKGTEAAGVTSVEIRETSIPDRFSFRADRPFLFLIRERFSETILFVGILVEPPEA